MKKNYLFVAISLIIVAVLSLVYVFFYSDNEKKDESNEVRITGYKEEIEGATAKVTFDNNSISFDVNFEKKDATVTYTVTITNPKDTDVKVKSINGFESSNQQEPTSIVYELVDLLESDKIEANKTREFTVLVKFVGEEFHENMSKKATLSLVFE